MKVLITNSISLVMQSVHTLLGYSLIGALKGFQFLQLHLVDWHQVVEGNTALAATVSVKSVVLLPLPR